MKKRRILLQYPGDIEKALFDPAGRDGCTEPFIRLRAALESAGYVIEPPTRAALKDAAWLLFWDVPSATNAHGVRGALRRLKQGFAERTRNWLKEAREAGLERVGVMLWEPATVCAANWSRDVYEQFKIVLTWDDTIVDDVRIHKMLFPIPEKWPAIAPVPYHEKKLLVNISSNKLSNHPGELYSSRVEAIRYFERTYPRDFDLFGHGWDAAPTPIGDARGWLPRPKPDFIEYESFRGTVPSKSAVLPRYRFALCYENSGDQPGYVTEKIFDVMRCGCVPIYLGAPNVTDYVDQGAFIDRRSFSSHAELSEFLARMTEAEHDTYLRSIARYLTSDRFAQFTSGRFVERLVSVLDL